MPEKPGRKKGSMDSINIRKRIKIKKAVESVLLSLPFMLFGCVRLLSEFGLNRFGWHSKTGNFR